jgi:hypothetical protein
VLAPTRLVQVMQQLLLMGAIDFAVQLDTR